MRHKLWSEIGKESCTTIKSQKQTLVLPYIRECFETVFPAWGENDLDLSKPIGPTRAVKRPLEHRRKQLKLGNKFQYTKERHFDRENGHQISMAS